jgi:hypothetical protein
MEVFMWRTVLGCLALILTAAVSLGVETEARAWLAVSPAIGHLAGRASDILVKVKHEKCTKEKVCDYFAPATSCSNPPCCKRWHLEKNCEATNQGGAGSTQQSGTSGESSPPPEKQLRRWCIVFEIKDQELGQKLDVARAKCSNEYRGNWQTTTGQGNASGRLEACCHYIY